MTANKIIEGMEDALAIARGGSLKPCPFCGGEAEFCVGKTGDDKDWHYIECSVCQAMGPHVSYAAHEIRLQEALAEAWNTRAADPRIAELEAENHRLRNRAQAEGFWLGKTTEKEVKP